MCEVKTTYSIFFFFFAPYQPPSFCNGGQSGTWTYMACVPGFPGAPGRDGSDGAKGNQGTPGKTGPQGPPGAEGKKGAKGEPGVQGPSGQKGQRGDRGDSGTPRLSSHMNWKECTWKKEDAKDSGEIYVSGLSIFLLRILCFLSHLYCLEMKLFLKEHKKLFLSFFFSDDKSYNSQFTLIKNYFHLTALYIQ